MLRRVIVGRVAGSCDDFAITGAEPGVIRAMLREDLEVQLAAEVEQSLEARPG